MRIWSGYGSDIAHWFTDWTSAWVAFLLITILLGLGFLEVRQTRNPQQPAQHRQDLTGQRPPSIGQKHPTEGEHRSAEQAYWERHIETQSRLDWVGWAALVVSAFATVLLILTFQQTRRQADAAVNASVYFGDKFHILEVVQPDSKTGQDVLFSIGNSGASTTRFLAYQTACTISAEALSDPYDRKLLRTKRIRHIALAPKREIEPIACITNVSELLKVVLQHYWIYVFGAATYQDTSNPSFQHRIEFCLQAHGGGVGDGRITTQQEECERHNCADDECTTP